jgi:hypothetical protein
MRGGFGFLEGADHRASLSSLVISTLVTDTSQTLEVAFARVYNWDVAQRRKEREGGDSIDDKKRGSPNG